MTRVLLVCTANICRSPMAEALFKRRAADRDPSLVVRSAGLLEAGQPAAPGTQRALQLAGLDGSAHVSTKLTGDFAGKADLVLGMERRHVQEVALLAPTAFPRTFTLKELVRRGGETGPRAAGESIPEWLQRMQAGRTPRDLLGSDTSDDVADPYGGEEEGYERTLREIDGLVARAVDLIWPPPL
jgi:protein-tyrosine phosphatase